MAKEKLRIYKTSVYICDVEEEIPFGTSVSQFLSEKEVAVAKKRGQFPWYKVDETFAVVPEKKIDMEASFY